MRIAVYPSVLYGADFLELSVRSVLPHVDVVYVVVMTRPWGGTSGVEYRSEWIPWPERFDDTREILAGMREPNVHVLEAEKFSPWDRWSYGLDVVRGNNVATDEVVFIDPDCVFSRGEAARVFGEWDAHPEYQWAHVGQVEFWKTTEWVVERDRAMVGLHRGDLALLSSEVRKAWGVEAPMSKRLAGRVYNLGFCVSDAAMRWKFLCSLAFSPVVGESLPNPEWYEEKWLGWTPGTRNLEVSLGCEGSIPCAMPYVGTVPNEIVEAVRRARGG